MEATTKKDIARQIFQIVREVLGLTPEVKPEHVDEGAALVEEVIQEYLDDKYGKDLW